MAAIPIATLVWKLNAPVSRRLTMSDSRLQRWTSVLRLPVQRQKQARSDNAGTEDRRFRLGSQITSGWLIQGGYLVERLQIEMRHYGSR